MSSQPYFRQIILLFVISGLELETESLPELLKLWPSALLGMVSILFITPLFAFVYRYLPLNTFAMIGLGVFALSPTSVSSGVVLVSQCHGNIPLSLFLTVATNILCVFIIPFMIPILIAGDISANLTPIHILVQLIYTVLIPFLFGKLILRNINVIKQWSGRHRDFLKLSSIFLLIVIPWIKISASVESFNQISALQFVLIAIFSLLMHLVFICFNGAISWAVRMPTEIRKAIVIMCSQKTLTVSFAVAASLPKTEYSGLYPIPIIIGHLMQLIFDSILVVIWAGPKTTKSSAIENHEEIEVA